MGCSGSKEAAGEEKKTATTPVEQEKEKAPEQEPSQSIGAIAAQLAAEVGVSDDDDEDEKDTPDAKPEAPTQTPVQTHPQPQPPAAETSLPEPTPAESPKPVPTATTPTVKLASHIARHGWIVVNINGKRAGKVVVALKGKGVELAEEKFEELYRGADIEPNSLSIDTVEPKLYFIMDKRAAGLENMDGVHAIVEEGEDCIQAIRDAPEDAEITVKQAHIYPVKKSKS